MVRPQRDRPAEAFDRVAAARERHEDISAVEPGFDEIRLRGDRAVELVERELGAAELLLRDADQVVCGGEFRLRLDGPAGELDALVEAALLAVDRRETEQRAAVALFERQHLRVSLRRRRQVAPPMQQRGLLHQERGGRCHGGSWSLGASAAGNRAFPVVRETLYPACSDGRRRCDSGRCKAKSKIAATAS